jgi:hypothetical protein
MKKSELEKNENIPVIIRHMAEHVLNENNSNGVKFNYVQTLKNIRDYCNQIISHYEKSDDRFVRKIRNSK